MPFPPNTIGLIDTSELTLYYPRPIDEVYQSMPAALTSAGEWLAGGASEVTICTVRYDNMEGIFYEARPLITLRAHEALHPPEEDEE